jgi:nucleoside-diphosphate-sugar epimerase
MNILVTGATGLVGNLIARRLAFEQHQVYALARDAARAAHVKDVVTKIVVADLTVPSTLDNALEGVDTIIHCAGLVGSGRGAAEDYFRINVEGTRALVNAAKGKGIKRFVFMSTAGVYGLNMLKGNVDETVPLRKSNGYTNSKIAAEEIVRNSGLEYVILRPYWITGGGDRFLIPAVGKMLLNGTFTYLGDGQQEWSLSAVENVSAAVAMAATHPKAGNQIFNVADATVKVSETVDVIAKALEVPAPTRHSSPLSVGIKVFLHQSPDDPHHFMTIDLFFPLWRTMTLNAEKIRRELGYQPRIPWQDSVTAGAREWKKQQAIQ